MSEWLQHISRAAEGRATRSTALQPLLWLMAILLASIAGASASGAPEWLLVVLVCMAGLSLLSALAAYLWFAIKQPDSLRSEKFVIRKMEIEQASIGDSLRGITDNPMIQTRMLTEPVKGGNASE